MMLISNATIGLFLVVFVENDHVLELLKMK